MIPTEAMSLYIIYDITKINALNSSNVLYILLIHTPETVNVNN